MSQSSGWRLRGKGRRAAAGGGNGDARDRSFVFGGESVNEMRSYKGREL
jgi:hypothetical protein